MLMLLVDMHFLELRFQDPVKPGFSASIRYNNSFECEAMSLYPFLNFTSAV